MNKQLKDAILTNKQRTSSLNGWYIINAAFAKLLLDLNVANYRTVRQDRVNVFANDMMNGKWQKNGETIVINKDGILADGQHRLLAVVKSDSVITAYIVFDADVSSVIDLNLTRNIKQMFASEGTGVSNFEIGTGKLILNYGSKNENFGYNETKDYIKERLGIIRQATSIAISGCTKTAKSVGQKAACAAIIYCLLKTKEVSEADMREFFKIANSGNVVGNLKNPSPALVFRNQMLDIVVGGGRAAQKAQLEITYQALKDFKADKTRIRGYKYDTADAERLVQSVYESEEPKAA